MTTSEPDLSVPFRRPAVTRSVGVVRSTAPTYAFLPGREDNPLVESFIHGDWLALLVSVAKHQLANFDGVVTGNIPWFLPDDGGPCSPDVMTIPGLSRRPDGAVMKGDVEISSYRQGSNDPSPTITIEVLSKSNTRAEMLDKHLRYLEVGVELVLTVDPQRQQVQRWSLVDGVPIPTDVVGVYLAELDLTFVRGTDGLAMCCPAGRLVGPAADPLTWMAEERQRADAAEDRVIAAETRAEESAAQARESAAQARESAAQAQALTARTAELEAEVARLRAEHGDHP
jgi:Uma2 family endonuclease